MSRRSQYLLGAVLAVVLVWLFLRNANLAEVGAALRGVRPGLVAAAVGTVLLTTVQRIVRWRMILAPVGPLPWKPLATATLAGWGVSFLAPGRLGEVVRPLLLARRTDVRAATAIGSIVLERVFDAAAVLAFLGGYLVLVDPPAASEGRAVMELLRFIGGALLAGLLVFFASAWLAAARPQWRRRADAWTRRWLPGRIADILRSFVDGMAGAASPSLVLASGAASLVLWGTALLTYGLLLSAVGIDLPWHATIPILCVIVVGVLIPTPGAVGSFHKAAQIALVSLFGVGNSSAVAFAIVAHAVAMIPPALLGIGALVGEGLTPGAVQRIAEDASEEPSAESAV